MIHVVYFSNVTKNTERFVRKLDIPASQIPIKGSAKRVSVPYVLITPTYGDSTPNSFVPRQVQRFLENEEHSRLLSGVVAGGNLAFAHEYALAGTLISSKYSVPLIEKFELSGTRRVVASVLNRLEAL